MFNQVETQRTLTNSLVDDYLLTWFEAFLIDRKARGLADGTLRFYRFKLKLFSDFCETQVVTQIHQLTPTLLRQYLLYLEGTYHNEGGRHAAYRTLRAFLYWYEDEVEPEGWKNPIHKVKAPKVPTEPIDPVSIDVVSKMVKVCERGTFTGDRDGAMIMSLEQLVIDAEVFRMAKQAHRGISTRDEMWLDNVIQRVSPGGNFLGEKSTAVNMRSREWLIPKLSVHKTQKAWEDAGKKDILDEAREKVSFTRKFGKSTAQANGQKRLRLYTADLDEIKKIYVVQKSQPRFSFSGVG